MDADDLQEFELALDIHGRLTLEDAWRLITEVRRLRVLLSWEAGGLSEGQAARALGTDRVTLRGWREQALTGVIEPLPAAGE